MKRIVFACLVLLWGCHKDTEPTKSPEEQLPPATQEGKMTFGCLIDGKPWTPKGGIIPPPLSVSYNELTGQLNVSAIRKIGIDDLLQSVNVYSVSKDTGHFSIPLLKSVVIDTSSFCTSSPFGYVNGIGMSISKNLSEGALVITKLDFSSGIISGIFSFDAYSPDCKNTVKITQGRFDIKYK